MNKVLLLVASLSICLNIVAQDLEIAGKVKIESMDKDSTADSVVVRLNNGTLAVRDISTLSDFQVSPSLVSSLEIGGQPTSVYVSG